MRGDHLRWNRIAALLSGRLLGGYLSGLDPMDDRPRRYPSVCRELFHRKKSWLIQILIIQFSVVM